MSSAPVMRGIRAAILVAGLFAVPVQAQEGKPMASDEAQATDDDSLARVRRQLEREPTLKLDLPQAQTPTFRVTIEQRRYMLTFDEWLHKEFDLTPFQRKWAEFNAKSALFTPYGVDLLQLYDRLDRLSKEHESRKAREQVARELQQLKPAKPMEDQLLPPDKRQPQYSN